MEAAERAIQCAGSLAEALNGLAALICPSPYARAHVKTCHPTAVAHLRTLRDEFGPELVRTSSAVSRLPEALSVLEAHSPEEWTDEARRSLRAVLNPSLVELGVAFPSSDRCPLHGDLCGVPPPSR